MVGRRWIYAILKTTRPERKRKERLLEFELVSQSTFPTIRITKQVVLYVK